MKNQVKIYLYDEPRAKNLNATTLKTYVQENLPLHTVQARPDIFAFAQEGLDRERRAKIIEEIAEGLASVKVRNVAKAYHNFSPLKGEVNFERRRFLNQSSQVFGLLYDGFGLMDLFHGLIPKSERNLKHVHIIFTNQLIGTWDDNAGGYHVRASVYGFPSIISTSGLVEGPAKPREYYLIKQPAATLGMEEIALSEFKQKHKGEFIDYDDERLTEVLKGYVMQAVIYQLTGQAFCEDRNCRFYNAHWQSELIRAQLGGSEFCSYHQEMLKKFATKSQVASHKSQAREVL